MAFINRYSSTQNGAIVITGNTLGLSKANNANSPGTNDSIGGFITTSTTLPTPAAWAGVVNLANGENITLNWQQNSSSAFLNMLAGSTVVYAELIWGGLAKNGSLDVTSSINNSVRFTTPLSTTLVSPNSATSFSVTPSGSTDVWYSRSQNVTTIVNSSGIGKYTVGSVPAVLNSSNDTTNFAGWSLIVVYRNTSLPARNMSVFSGGELVNTGRTIDTTVSGFITPASGVITARILASAAEGDATRTGDYMQFGPNTSSLTKLFGPNNPANPPNTLNNFFGSQINIGDPLNPNVGSLDTTGSFGNRNQNAFSATNISGGRQGWDITNVNGSSAITNGQTSATVRFTSSSEIYLPNGLAIQIDTISADISVTKTGIPNIVTSKQILTYTMVVTNTGPNTAQNVVLYDTVPSAILNPEYSTNSGVTWNPWVGSYSIGNLLVGSVVNIQLRGTVSPSAIGTITNTALISSITPDSNLDNNTSTLGTQVNTLADISVIKTANKNTVIAGELLTYNIVLSNDGPSDAQNVILTDTVPNQILNQEFSINGGSTWNPWISNYTIGTLQSDSSLTIQIRGIVSSASMGTLANTAIISSATFDPNLSNNTSTVNTFVDTKADISILKVSNPSALNAGENLIYTINISNAGPSDSQNITLTDTIPNEILNPEYSVDGGTTWNSWVNPYSVGSIANGFSKIIELRGTVNPSVNLESITNTAIINSTTFDPNINNNSSNSTTQINTSADVSIIKLVNQSPVVAGDLLTYDMLISNAGPSDAQNVVLVDTIPTDILNTEYSTDGGLTWNIWSNTYTVGTLAKGNSTSIKIRGTVNSSVTNTITNTAIISSTTLDLNPTNNISTVNSKVDALADILVIKQDNPNPVIAGQTLTYPIVVLNNGLSDAQNVVLIDTIPGEILNPQYSSDGGITWSPWISPYNIGTIVNGNSKTIQIRGTVSSSITEPIVNTALITSSTPDPDFDDNVSNITTQVNTLADLYIEKTANPSPAKAGQLLTYTVLISNFGPSDAKNVSLTDTVPNDILSPEYSSDGGIIWNPWISPYNIGTIVNGDSKTIQIRGTVNPLSTGIITNTAIVNSTTLDEDLTNNTSSIITGINNTADISIEKTETPNPVTAGQMLTYTLLVSNLGPDDAQAVTLNDTIPSALTGVQFSIDGGGTWNPWSTPYYIGTLPNSTSKTIQIKGTVNPLSTGIITNTATVNSITADDNPDNNTSTVNTAINGLADILVNKTCSPNPVIAGEILTYNIVVFNTGPNDAQNVTLSDSIPNEISGAEFSSDGGFTWNSWVSPYSIGTIVNGASKTIQIRGSVDSSVTAHFNNTAVVSSSTPDSNLDDNTSTIIAQVDTRANISVIKTSNENSVIPGDTIVYNILVSNGGPSDAQDITLIDSVPGDILNPEYSSDGGFNWNPWVSPYSMGTIVNGDSKTIQIRGTVSLSATGNITNTAIVNSRTLDLFPEDNVSTNTVFVDNSANMSVLKVVNPKVVNAGENLVYTILISNAGPSSSEGTLLIDTIPSQVLNPEYSSDGGINWNPWISPYNVGTLASGELRAIDIRGTISPSANESISNTAIVTSSKPDTNLNNNISTTTLSINSLADVSIEKLSNPISATAGNLLTYTMILSNAGPSDAQNVILIDTVPANILNPEYSSDSGINWSPWISPYSIGTLPSSSELTIQIRGIVSPSSTETITNTAIINSTTPDLDTNDNISTIDTPLETLADVSVTKISAPNPVVTEDLLTYNIVVSNAGPSDAQNVILIDTIPSEIYNIEFSSDGGLNWNSSWGGFYTIGTLPSNTSKTLQIRGLVASATTSSIANTAIVSSTTSDPNLENNSFTDIAQVEVRADISVVKISTPTVVNAGENIAYEIIVSNEGPSDAINTTLSDIIPDDILNPEYSTDGGVNWSPWVSPYIIGMIEEEEYASIKIRGTVSPSATKDITNTATANSTTPDLYPDNNSYSVVTKVNTLADISIIKLGDKNFVTNGELLTYTMEISNIGPSDALNVVLTDSIPDDILNPEYSLDEGLTWSPWTNPYNIGILATGASIKIMIRGIISPLATDTLTNTAIINSTTTDPNTLNNVSTNIVNVRIANLNALKSSDKMYAKLGDILIYTITITNTGNTTANNVCLSDILDPNLEFVDGSLSINGINQPGAKLSNKD